MRFAFALLALLATTSVGSARELRPGANHRLGDDSFVARFGRMPTPADGEKARMRVHLEYVRDLLAARAPTSPELAGRRAALLGYLGDYIAAGITPRNTYVPRRNPVFIDAQGNICAVGYLIARSVGRALPEQIAATHRLSYLEDIAAAMPEVAAWVRTSGLTLEELASIQPGYEGPDVQHLEGWDLAGAEDGKLHEESEDISLDGEIKRRQMVGVWKRTTREGKVLGRGTFRNGAGTWTSFRPDGTKLAEGPFVRNRPEGEWRFFHASGRLAAVGPMHEGKRDGRWTFFYDAQGSPKLSTGRFAMGMTVGGWSHFDAAGKLVATAAGTPWSDTGLTLDIAPGADGVRHIITRGAPADDSRLDTFALGADKLYIVDRNEMYDAGGNLLEKDGGKWTSQACNWSARRKRMAAAGDVFTLYRTMVFPYGRRTGTEEIVCSGPRKVLAAPRAKRLDAMLASHGTMHAPIPAWSFDEPADAEEAVAETSDDPDPEAGSPAIPADNPADMATYLTDHMRWYIEWPHIDETFLAVYRSLPGYSGGTAEAPDRG